MAKIFRRKKNGREVGTFYVRPKGGGRPISLALDGAPCTDATLARKRAALALKGRWPPAAVEAAKRAARAEHVPESPEDDLDPGESPKGGGLADAESVPSPSAPPAHPSPEPSGGAEAGDEPDPVAAAAAAAADAAGPADAPSPVADDEQARREQWGRDFAARFGIGAIASGMPAGITPGAIVTMAELKLFHGVLDRRAAKLSPPRTIKLDPAAVEAPAQMLAMAWDEQLRRWGLDLAKVEPWMAIVGATVGLIVACAGAPLVPREGAPGGAA